MATKLDQKFAESVRVGVNALILEVERLEGYCERLEKAVVNAMAAVDQAEEREGYIGHQALKREAMALGLYSPKHELDPV